MAWLRSYRTKLRALVLGLGLLGIGATGWVASVGASAAMREATYSRLAAIRETRSRQIERYFADVSNHVLALSSDEATLEALAQFRDSWSRVPPPSPEQLNALDRYYTTEFLPRVDPSVEQARASAWLPTERETRSVQSVFLATNPHPVGAKDLLVTAPASGPYNLAHARFHPTFHRYLSAFGFYDIFLIDAETRRVLYTVSKEIDLGITLGEMPYRESGLARAVERALDLDSPEQVVIEDYSPYPPSYYSPAAFLAAPIWSAGDKVGVLAIQVSVAEVNRVMAGERRWREEGLGSTGQSYLVAADGSVRSDPRAHQEDPAAFLRQLQQLNVTRASAPAIAHHGTTILNLHVDPEFATRVTGARGTELGVDLRGVEVLRSHAPITVPGLQWAVVAEIDAAEALAPVRALRWRILGIGAVVSLVFLGVSAGLGRSVTTPVLALARSATRLGMRDFGQRVAVESNDEIGELAQAFNRMAERLEKTTVSKDELEVLAGRLITAQEDERRRLARELHDDLTQRLAALSIEAGLLEHGSDASTDVARERLARVRAELARLSTEIHRLSHRLHPAALVDLGLVAAIESEGRALFERGGPPVDIDANGTFEDLHPDVQLALYRVVQESLHNIQKHAQAEQVTIAVQREPNAVVLVVTDDGRGFDRRAAGWRAGLGLASMEERAKLLGGHLRIDSTPGTGTRIEMRLPLAATETA